MRSGDDWSGGFPGITALRSVGSSFVGRYAAWDHPRGLDANEVAQLTAAGFDILTYYEEGNSWIAGGYSAGVRAGETARAVWASVGQHSDVPLFLAADSDFTSGQLAPIYGALDGLASVIGRENCGIYGGVAVVHSALRDKKATYGVQAGAWRYRASEVGVSDPYGWSPLAQVRQDGYNVIVGGVNCDHLTALAGDFGQWRRAVIDVSTPIVTLPIENPNRWDKNPAIKLGDHGQEVGWAQFTLNSAFNAKIAIAADPVFDALTLQWVRTLQTYSKLKVDGIIGEATWHVLGVYVARVHRYDACPTLKVGETDASTEGKVHVLQQALNGVSVHGHTPMKVDGLFGSGTRNTLVQYQRNRHLTPDGIAGPTTWNDLASLLTRYGK